MVEYKLSRMEPKLKNVYKVIRGFLILTILMNVAISAYYLIFNQKPELENVIHEDISFRLQLVFVATITLIATYLPSYLDSRKNIQLPKVLEITVIIFMIAAGYLSQRFNLFVRFHWWDDVLHFTSGTFIAVAGFLLIYMLNYRYSFDLNPWLIAIFTFSFSVAVAVFWEIAEFAADALWQTNYQKWDVPADTPLLGKPYQGLALRDTMADLIIASTGALIVSVLVFFSVNKNSDETIRKISKLFNKNQ